MGGKRTPALASVGIVEVSDLDGAFIEIIKQACINAHLAEVFPKRLPVGSAAADWTVVNANHSIAPHIGFRLARNAHLVRRKIGHSPCEPTTEGAVTVCNPRRLAWQLYSDVAAVAASLNGHSNL